MEPPPDRARTAAQQAGDAAERLVGDYLERLGWTILARNVRVGRKEIDLVAHDPGPPGATVLVEVRWRRSRAFGLPEETFGHVKRAHLRAALGRLLEAGRLPDGQLLSGGAIRVDLVVVEPAAAGDGRPRIRHHRDALAG
jgi:putative endonuclease